MKKLYIVASPIGNLKDITLRALEVLKEVDVVLAEDTRVTKKLLTHFGISKSVVRYVYGKDYSRFDSIALLTDAGTPSISDPGTGLVKDLIKQNFEIVTIPGPSALTAIISVSDIELADFIFLGFPPAKKGRQKFFNNIANHNMPVILYESPHRIIKTLNELKKALGERYINVGRELTKIHEEVFRGTISKAIEHITGERERGEFAIVIDIK